MAIELKMNTNIRDGIELLHNEELNVNPIIDLNGVRYLLDVDTFLYRGALIWTRFDIATQLPLDEVSYTRPYASHNIFGELLFSGSSTVSPYPLQTETFPSFPVPDENGTVIP